MGLFDENTTKQLQGILSQMENHVQLVLFTQEIECQFCKEAHQFADEFAALDSQLSLTVYRLVDDKDVAEKYGINLAPVLLLLDKDGQDTRIRFYGIPAGFEINSFLFTVLAVSGRREEVPPEINERIARIDKDINLQVFVSLSCPHCPDAVMAANFLALANPLIHAEMIEASMFTHLAIRHNVSGVPKTVVNGGKAEWVGAAPIPVILDTLEKLEA